MAAVDPNLETIVEFVGQDRDGARLPDIVAHVNQPRRTVQHWLADLVAAGRLKAKGNARATRYVVPKPRLAVAVESAATGPATTAALPSTRTPPPTSTAGQPTGIPPSIPPAAGRPSAVDESSSLPRTLQQSAGSVPVTSSIIRRQPAASAPPTGGKSTDAPFSRHAPPADAPFARYPDFEELYYHIFPRIVRAPMNRTNAESLVREQADFDYRTDPKRKQAFIAAAMAKLDALTLADVHPYGVGPATYADWRRAWNEPPGTRHW